MYVFMYHYHGVKQFQLINLKRYSVLCCTSEIGTWLLLRLPLHTFALPTKRHHCTASLSLPLYFVSGWLKAIISAVNILNIQYVIVIIQITAKHITTPQNTLNHHHHLRSSGDTRQMSSVHKHTTQEIGYQEDSSSGLSLN